MLAVASLPVLLLGTIVMAYNLPLLKITQVELAGAQTLDVPRTKASLRLEGTNMLSVDAPIIEKTLKQQPVVKAVTVRKQWPNKLIVQIEERKPFAFWQTPDGTYTVDDEGFVIAESPAPGPLPAITSHEGGVRVGARVPQSVLGLARTLGTRIAQETGAKPREFEYSAAQGMTVTTDQGWSAVFGDERDTDFKLAALDAVLRSAKDHKLGFQYVDLRYGERPYLR